MKPLRYYTVEFEDGKVRKEKTTSPEAAALRASLERQVSGNPSKVRQVLLAGVPGDN